MLNGQADAEQQCEQGEELAVGQRDQAGVTEPIGGERATEQRGRCAGRQREEPDVGGTGADDRHATPADDVTFLNCDVAEAVRIALEAADGKNLEVLSHPSEHSSSSAA